MPSNMVFIAVFNSLGSLDPLNTHMLYTFTINEAQLDRITDYLDRQYTDRPDQYIFSVQRSLIEDRIIVIVDCSEQTAVILELMC